MLLSLTESVFILISVQYLGIDAKAISNVDFEAPLENPQVRSKLRRLRECLSNKNGGQLADNLRPMREYQRTTDPNLRVLRQMLSNYLKETKTLDKRDVSKRRDIMGKAEKSKKINPNSKARTNGDPKFEDWTSWSPCSVSCGKGRHIRWRHCRQNCEVETEMGEKECQLPACPNKLFGLIKLSVEELKRVHVKVVSVHKGFQKGHRTFLGKFVPVNQEHCRNNVNITHCQHLRNFGTLGTERIQIPRRNWLSSSSPLRNIESGEIMLIQPMF
ncbi:hypothetical protein JTB14_037048 [Gonioctena quinquepunctata]|nr:hypothetical protein JTB14_037048 [Gonioctena quinquepunctata]